jgi:GNAT superfamily N-acetyltransferase
MDITIKKANLKDMSAIYSLVYELAVFEQEPKALNITTKEYEEAFSEKLMDAIVASDGDQIIGIAVFYMTFSTWKGKCLYLEDFYVQPKYRKYGVGQKLFDAFLREAKDRGSKLTKWQVLDWNEIGLNFYEKNNAIIEKNWWNGKIFFDEI